MRLLTALLFVALLVSCKPGADSKQTAPDTAKADSAATPETTTTGTDAAATPDGGPKTSKGTSLASKDQQISYLIGLNVGGGLKDNDLKLDTKLIAEGIDDALQGVGTLSQEQQMTLMQDFQNEMRVKAQAKMEAEGKVNSEAAVKFLAENKTKEGVKTTASGLQYKVLNETGGKTKPKPESTVKVHYTGKLIDGTVFDSSVQRGQPAEFPVGQVIPGWTEAIQLMAVGDKYELYIPPELAYGPQSQGKIPANALLIFEVELLEIM